MFFLSVRLIRFLYFRVRVNLLIYPNQKLYSAFSQYVRSFVDFSKTSHIFRYFFSLLATELPGTHRPQIGQYTYGWLRPHRRPTSFVVGLGTYPSKPNPAQDTSESTHTHTPLLVPWPQYSVSDPVIFLKSAVRDSAEVEPRICLVHAPLPLSPPVNSSIAALPLASAFWPGHVWVFYFFDLLLM